MEQPTDSQLREALAAVGNTTRFEGEADVLRAPSAELQKHRDEAESATRSLLARAGVDVEELEKLQSQYRAELDRVAEELRLEAVSKFKSRDLLHPGHDEKRKLIDKGVGVFPVGIQPHDPPIMLDKPFLIQPTHAIVSGEQIAPFDSWAKTTFKRTTSREEGLSFYYKWENPHNARVTIDVVTSLGFHGFCRVHAEGAFWNWTDSRLRVFCALAIRPWSQQPHHELGDLKDVITLNARSISLRDDDSSAHVFLSHDLRSSSHSWVVIEPNELVVFEVAVVFLSSVDGNGYTSVDFAHDGAWFQISSPYLAIGVWTP